MNLGKQLLCASVCVTALAWSCAANAQDSARDIQIEEVVVTAQKRSENLQNVPMSVTAISAAEVESRHIYDPAQLQFIAPSLQLKSFNAAVGATNFSVRGVGTLSFANSIDASVTTVIDGVVMGRPEMGVMNFLDLQQIEVLNGPQGMLFGKNASAGLVNITTKRPVLGVYEGLARAEAAQINSPESPIQYLTQGVLNLPLGEDAAIRLSASFTHTPALLKNLVNAPGSKWDQDQYNLKAKFYWAPNEKLNVFVAGDFAKSEGIGAGSAADRRVLPTSFFAPENTQLGIVPSPENAFSSYGAKTNVLFKVGGAQANVDYQFDNGFILTNILAYRFFKAQNTFDSDKHRINILDLNSQRAKNTQVTNELRLTSPTGGRFEYQVGLYYYQGDIDMRAMAAGNNGLPAPAPPATSRVGIVSDGALASTSYAVFGQGTVNFTDDLRLVLGARYTRDELSVSTVNSLLGGALAPFGAVGVRNQALDQENISWRFSGQYDVTDDIMTYVTAARGYKGPGFNLSIDVNAPQIAPEYPMLYEAGIKSTLFDRRLILNLSAYWESFEDFQAQAFDVPSNGYVLLNAGELISRGAELQATAIPIENLTLNLGVSYVDAYFKTFMADRCYADQPGCRVNGTVDSSGNRLPNAPKWTTTLSAAYKRDLTGEIEGFAQGSLYHRSGINFNSNGDPRTVQAAYTVFDGSVGFGDIGGRWKASLFCRNCFDERYVTFINASSQSRRDYYHMFGLNSFRTIGLSLEGRF
ncbi:TonB-dependent receptor [Phenylobacterium sp.]|uniref:TonB-dependent receptor n=1 Tax=Phenylobacterium sp. TaxID=1871053 RepID=UPI0027358A39|nr:TonB-dependent receptor [Phenylobacterium sp.]MDP3853657.1 TonB-dependent receptor [Phenylobacterium sp.]